jgi:hypothetical protein
MRRISEVGEQEDHITFRRVEIYIYGAREGDTIYVADHVDIFKQSNSKYIIYKLPRFSCSRSIVSNKLLKFPAPNP